MRSGRKRANKIRQILRHIVKHYGNDQWVSNEYFYRMVQEKMPKYQQWSSRYTPWKKTLTYMSIVMLTRELGLPKRRKYYKGRKYVEYQMVRHG